MRGHRCTPEAVVTYRVTVAVPSGISRDTPKMDAAAFIPEIIQAVDQRCAPLEVLNIDVEEVEHDVQY